MTISGTLVSTTRYRQGQAVGGGVAVSVGQGQGRAAIGLYIVLQRVLDGGGVDFREVRRASMSTSD